jgi:hypothetical protein
MSTMERNRQQSTMNVMPRATSIQEDEKPKGPVKKNDIREIRTLRQLGRVNLDLDSPRMKEAMDTLGVSEEELEKK